MSRTRVRFGRGAGRDARGRARPRAARDGRARGSGGCAPRRVAGPAGAAKRPVFDERPYAFASQSPNESGHTYTRARFAPLHRTISSHRLLGRCPSRWQNSTWRRAALALLSAHLCNLNSSKKKNRDIRTCGARLPCAIWARRPLAPASSSSLARGRGADGMRLRAGPHRCCNGTTAAR